MRATVLVLVETIDDYLPLLEQRGFIPILAKTPSLRAAAIEAHGPSIDAVLTRGPLGLRAEEMRALPKLKIICVLGAEMIYNGHTRTVPVMLVLAMTAFLATVAVARYVSKQDPS